MERNPENRVDPRSWTVSVAPGVVPRLLATAPTAGGIRTLAEHRAVYPAPPPVRPGGDPRIIDEIERAGITGRGGANFPGHLKWKAVASGRGRPIAVMDGAEGEPASAKDATLMSRVPHLVLDGAVFAAAGIGAERLFICVGDHSSPAVAGIEHALEERAASEEVGIPVEMRLVPDRYVAGEARSLVHLINGGPAVPTSSPPRTSEQGVGKRPTLVNNAETLAHVTLVMAHGVDWYRSVGTVDEPGTRLVSLSGALTHPVVCEIEPDARLLDVFVANGGDPSLVSGVLVGGNYGTWLSPDEAFGARLSIASLKAVGASPGCGVLYFLPSDICGVSAVADIASWFSRESSGQCGPCVFGLAAVAKAMRAIASGFGGEPMIDRVHHLTAEIRGRGGCNHPDGAVQMVRSGLAVFADDVRLHRDGRCAVRTRPKVAV
ncbi:MAG: NADH-ubiquinone oxidoreductase-F iron-sulfur binding region domain-containing protein [Actinomycetota bacterium]